MNLPDKKDLPIGTLFYIKEFDVPLAQIPDGDKSMWLNWFCCKPKTYDAEYLKPGNNWQAGSFEEWQKIIQDSVNQ